MRLPLIASALAVVLLAFSAIILLHVVMAVTSARRKRDQYLKEIALFGEIRSGQPVTVQTTDIEPSEFDEPSPPNCRDTN